MRWDPPLGELVCTYCHGRGRVTGPSLFGYLWWRLTGRCLTQRCPECHAI